MRQQLIQIKGTMNMKRMQNFTSGGLRRKLGSAVAVLVAWGLMSVAATGSTPTQADPVQEPAQPPAHSQAQAPSKEPAQQPAQPPAAQPAQPPAEQPAQPPAQQPPAEQPAQPPAQQPPAEQPPAEQPAQPPDQQPPQPPAAAQKQPGARISLHLENANLLQVIGIIAAELKMNYVMDPGVKGVVNINTLGNLRQEDLLSLLQTILRANGATAVQSGSFWRIVPLEGAPRVPLPLTQDPTGASLPPDDRMVMNVVALSFVTAADMSKILSSYLSEAGHIVTHEPGNILLITDTSRSLRRLMELVNLFDRSALAQQRVRLFPIENSQASRLVEDLEEIFQAYALSEKGAAVRFIALERINSILAATPNPEVYAEVQQWIEKLDKPVRRGGLQNFTYEVENRAVEELAFVLAGLYGTSRSMMDPAATGGAAPGMAMPGMAGPGMIAQGMMAAGGVGAAGGRMTPGGQQSAIGGMGRTSRGPMQIVIPAMPGGMLQGPARIVPDLINNTLVIQATPQDYEVILETLKELDVMPRQVLIEAKVYEVTLTGALAFGVEAFLQQRSGAFRKPLGQFGISGTETFPNPGLSASVGTLIGRSRELFLFLNAQENRGRTRVLSAPTILASDNTEARIQVGQEIPLQTQSGVAFGTVSPVSTFQRRDTGVILSVTPRINPSGLVSMSIEQEVSTPVSGGTLATIQQRSMSTQVTVQDGETIALGGIIAETRIVSTNRVPLLGRIPGLGLLFGTTSDATVRTELIVLITPTVIKDMGEAKVATQEFRDKLKELGKLLRQESESGQ